MPLVRDQAVVVRLTDYSETSQIAVVFTADAGLLHLIAKGARRGSKQRFAAGLDLLEWGDVSYAPPRGDASLATLTEWTQRDAFAGLRRDLLRLYCGLYAAEATVTLTEPGDPHPELFAALRDLLAALAGEASAPPLASQFQHALLRAIGLAPTLDRCVACGCTPAGGPIYFSATAGGALCRDCEMPYVEKRPMERELLAAQPGSGDAYAWFELLNYHLRHIAGRAFKSAPVLERELARRLRGARRN